MKKIASYEKFKPLENLDQAVASEGLKIVLLLRLSAIFPFTFLNYALGLTKISFKDFLLASIIGMFPGTLLYVYLGSLARNIALANSHRQAFWEWALFGVGVAASFAMAGYAAGLAKKFMAVTKVSD